MTDDERSSEARVLAERALGRLLAAGAPTSEQLIVLGGLVPPTLTRIGSPEVPAHLGTTDVDVLLVTHLTVNDDFGPIENALEAMQFRPHADGWRWSGQIEDRLVKIEFLCDLEDQPAEALVRPAGCSRLRAVNFRGTRYVERDTTSTYSTSPRAICPFDRRTAGYLLSKAASVRTRGADKDYYDFAYVLLHNNAGGPVAAANAIKASPLADALPGMGSTFVELRERFATIVPMVRGSMPAKHARSPPRTTS